MLIKQLNPAADLEVIKVPNVGKVFVREKLIWTITVKNNGPDIAKDVKIFKNLLKELKYISYTATKGNYGNEVWPIDSLSVGESTTLYLTTIKLEIGKKGQMKRKKIIDFMVKDYH